MSGLPMVLSVLPLPLFWQLNFTAIVLLIDISSTERINWIVYKLKRSL